MFLYQRLPCVKGAVAERLRDCVSMKYSFTIPPSFSCENATSLYTREAFVKNAYSHTKASSGRVIPRSVGKCLRSRQRGRRVRVPTESGGGECVPKRIRQSKRREISHRHASRATSLSEGGSYEKPPARGGWLFSFRLCYVFYFLSFALFFGLLMPKNRLKNGAKNAGERTNTIFIPLLPSLVEFLFAINNACRAEESLRQSRPRPRGRREYSPATKRTTRFPPRSRPQKYRKAF